LLLCLPPFAVAVANELLIDFFGKFHCLLGYICHLVFLVVVVATLFKKPKAASFRVATG